MMNCNNVAEAVTAYAKVLLQKMPGTTKQIMTNPPRRANLSAKTQTLISLT
jgi:hypothetical protein